MSQAAQPATAWHSLDTPLDDNETIMLAMRHNTMIRFGYREDGKWYDEHDHEIDPLYIIGWLPAPTHPHDMD